jgi:hypothetical protein
VLVVFGIAEAQIEVKYNAAIRYRECKCAVGTVIDLPSAVRFLQVLVTKVLDCLGQRDRRSVLRSLVVVGLLRERPEVR